MAMPIEEKIVCALSLLAIPFCIGMQINKSMQEGLNATDGLAWAAAVVLAVFTYHLYKGAE